MSNRPGSEQFCWKAPYAPPIASRTQQRFFVKPGASLVITTTAVSGAGRVWRPYDIPRADAIYTSNSSNGLPDLDADRTDFGGSRWASSEDSSLKSPVDEGQHCFMDGNPTGILRKTSSISAFSEGERLSQGTATKRGRHRKYDEFIDPTLPEEEQKKMRRLLSNRKSARMSRERKKQQLSEYMYREGILREQRDDALRKLAEQKTIAENLSREVMALRNQIAVKETAPVPFDQPAPECHDASFTDDVSFDLDDTWTHDFDIFDDDIDSQYTSN